MGASEGTNSFPWALDDDGLHRLTDYLAQTRPHTAVEFGSGKTTPIFRRYATHTVSFEHLPEWAEKTRALCRATQDPWWCRLSQRPRRTSELRVVEIGSLDTPIGPLAVYDTTLPAHVDFALIDGPPKRIGRLGVMFQLFPSLSHSSVVWLDDVDRPEETEILSVWQEHFPLQVRLVSERLAEIRLVAT